MVSRLIGLLYCIMSDYAPFRSHHDHLTQYRLRMTLLCSRKTKALLTWSQICTCCLANTYGHCHVSWQDSTNRCGTRLENEALVLFPIMLPGNTLSVWFKVYISISCCVTWEHREGVVTLQAENHWRSDAGKVHPIIDLEVESSWQGTCINNQSLLIYGETIPNHSSQVWYISLSNIQCLAKYSSPLAFFLFCCITTCHLNRFFFAFHVMDIHKIDKIR